MRRALALVLFPLATAAAVAQSNTIPGSGSRLADLSGLASYGRVGTYPTGSSGLAAGVTVCNPGTVPINWFAVMNPDHPCYAFLMCRDSNGRFSQISDWSYVKHAFASINGDCGGCIQPPQGSAQLGIHCNDTYDGFLNADRFDLGPPSEIDPWLLVWNPVGSYFDRGDPSVGPPADHDGQMSLTFQMTAAMDGVKHRIEVDDVDFAVPGATFVLAGRVMTRGETESTREDNQLSLRYTVTWSGTHWNFTNPSPQLPGTVLNQWTGAVLRSNTNGTADGRVWIGAKVTPLADGRWHYEYALHNRDNSRGIAGVHIPKCPSARIFNAGFRDIDRSTLDDWAVSSSGSEVAALASAGNPLEWNTVYNVWFDSDAAPAGGTVTLDEARIGAGALQFQVLDVPAPMRLGNEYLGAGCGSPAPGLFASGSPALANIPNATFGLGVTAHANTGVFLFAATAAVAQPIGGGCTQYVDSASTSSLGFGLTNASGTLARVAPVPNLAALEGVDLIFQGAELFTGGPAFGQFNLTNGLRVRIGNSRTGCP
ncbi:MAG TPA: hypothetical protein VK348_08650 [Planctomycetota bacterium]|nr:hypothetical protein [Planctomycetota bacterium]